MDSLYEPVPEQQVNQESTSGRTGSFISPLGENGKSTRQSFHGE